MVRKPWTRIAAMALAGAALAGCSHAIEGASQDADRNAAKVDAVAQEAAASAKQKADQAASSVKQSTDEAGAKVAAVTDKAADKVVVAAEAVKDAPKEADAALLVTPQVKAAVIRDVLLNDVRNQINIDTAHGVVHIKGHVVSQRMKDRASDVAQDAIRKDYPSYTISNELSVAADNN